ncbi:MAG TPA: hypothetical protein VJL27_00025 [Patescibacteria group bacterium]|nr:hypothetical protein [Patescibacteria group bacterium]
MKNEILKKLNQYSYKRYLLVLFLFILALIFGRNLDAMALEQKQLQDQIYLQQKIDSSIYQVPANQSEYRLKKIFSTKRGQCGRIFISLRNLSQTKNISDSSKENLSIIIKLSNDYGEEQSLAIFEVENRLFAQNKNFDYCANADYSDVIFQKDENDLDGSFEISNVSFYPIALEKHNINNMVETIEGNTDFGKIFYQSGPESEAANKPYVFLRKNQVIGQTFIANNEIISGIDIKLDFIGVGGQGNYSLELREAEEKNGHIELSTDRVTYYCFNKDSAEKNLKIEKDVYHIPLAAHLEIGKTYFIGINNETVKFNIINTLKIFGVSGNNSGGKVVYSVGGKTSRRSGSLFLKAYGADYIKIAGEKVLTGAKIIDNGDGTGSYIYEQKGTFSDYLDIERSITKDNNNSSIFFDNIQAGISGKDKDDNVFIYKINTIYPFEKMKIYAEQPGEGLTDTLLYYSFDNNNWQEIASNHDKPENALSQGEKNRFQEIIQGDGKTKNVYIKAAYNENDAKKKVVHLFNLKKLKIIAKLNIR